MPEKSGIIDEVSLPTLPVMSAKAQVIFFATCYVILPSGWLRVFYTCADDGLDLTKPKSVDFEMSPEVAAMLTSSSCELLVTEEGWPKFLFVPSPSETPHL
ncbi:hypothetical protein TYRP_023496 [Tyrophagus putrescentiae]|nr:hypothetical protein TYRP_023496 [Tyrophagus putrescentiae]